TVTSRRSATAAGGVAGAAGGAVVRPVPHSEQNFAVGATGAPHAGQPCASGSPHSLQNFASGALAVSHRGQVTAPSTCQLWPIRGLWKRCHGVRHSATYRLDMSLAEILAALARNRTVDITTTGARSGRAQRIEIWAWVAGDVVYLTGTPG